jgi:hypothetical protein
MEIVKTVNTTDAPEVMPRDFSNVPDDKNNGRI